MGRFSPSAGAIVDSRFALEEELARGGMGSIWLAQHLRLNAPCAVKFIDQSHLDSDLLRERFQREARAGAQLRSRHIVQIFDYGVWQGAPYIVMELLEGETLQERIERERRLSIPTVLGLMQGVAQALRVAAKNGIVHRDLKPENIFICREGDQEFTKVLDFGVVKVHEQGNLIDSSGKTKPGVLVGTPFYMSPEQADGTKPVDARSDLWSFAVIVYQCLVGKVPFQSEAFGNLIVKIISGELPIPSHVQPDVPPAFDAWWKRAAARNPDARFQDAITAYHQLWDALVDPAESMSGFPSPLSSRDSLAAIPAWSGPNSSARPPDSSPVPIAAPETEDPSSEPTAPRRHTLVATYLRPTAQAGSRKSRNGRYMLAAVLVAATLAAVLTAVQINESTTGLAPSQATPIIAPAPTATIPSTATARTQPRDERVSPTASLEPSLTDTERSPDPTPAVSAPESAKKSPRERSTPAKPPAPPKQRPPEPSAPDNARFPSGI